MKQLGCALALVILALITGQPVLATDTSPAAGHGFPYRVATAPASAADGVLSIRDIGWPSPSLASLAHAVPAADASLPTEREENTVPLSTGAWLMGLGLVAFIISRKRFKS